MRAGIQSSRRGTRFMFRRDVGYPLLCDVAKRRANSGEPARIVRKSEAISHNVCVYLMSAD